MCIYTHFSGESPLDPPPCLGGIPYPSPKFMLNPPLDYNKVHIQYIHTYIHTYKYTYRYTCHLKYKNKLYLVHTIICAFDAVHCFYAFSQQLKIFLFLRNIQFLIGICRHSPKPKYLVITLKQKILQQKHLEAYF